MYPYDEIDPYMEPPLEPGLVLKNAAAKRKSAGNALSNNVAAAPASVLPNAVDSYRGKAVDLFKQGSDLYNTEPDMKQLQEFARQRGQQGESSMLTALAAQFAGEGFAPLQEQMLKKAAASSEPMKFGAGMLSPDGKYIKDPFATQDKKAEFLMSQAKMYDQLATTAETKQAEQAYRAKQDEIVNEIRLMNAQTMRMNAGNKAEPGNFTHEGYTPQNERIVTNSKTGQSFTLGINPNGTPSYTPYMGASIPKASYEKEVTNATEALASAKRAEEIIKKVESNPSAFSLTANAVSMLPISMQGRVAGTVLNEETLKTRSDVLRQAAMEINQLYGAALSAGESAKAATFIPDAKDPPNVVIDKLKSARDWGYANANKHGSAIRQSAESRGGSAASNPSNELSAAELAELAALKAKHKGQP
jgi:hypothetical protein